MDFTTVKKYIRFFPFLALASAIAGVFIARALVSISMLCLVGYAVLLTDPRKTFKLFFQDKVLVALWLIFFLYLISGINSTEDKAFFLERIRLKLPFLALPVAFTVFKNNISKRQFQLLLYFFFIMVLLTAIVVTCQYLLHYETINDLYEEGRVMSTPFNHVRYSLMVAFAIFIGYYLFRQQFRLYYSWERWFIAAATIFLIFFIHLLAVRSGLVAFYLCVIYLIFHFVFRYRQLKTAMLLSTIILLLPVTAYMMLPSINAKVNYMKYDLEQLLLFKNASGLSDGGRILSIKEGMELFRENLWTGVGVGDLKQDMRQKLDDAPEHPRDYLLPHNQFVFVAAGTGLLGLLFFCFAIFLPLFDTRNLSNVLFVCFHIIILSSFFTEATIEEQMGTAFYLIFLLLMYIYIQSKS